MSVSELSEVRTVEARVLLDLAPNAECWASGDLRECRGVGPAVEFRHRHMFGFPVNEFTKASKGVRGTREYRDEGFVGVTVKATPKARR